VINLDGVVVSSADQPEPFARAGAPVSAPNPSALLRRRRGHGPKIDDALSALRAAGKLPPSLRPSEREERICEWLKRQGYTPKELPTRWSIRRHLETLERRAAG
jgi:hypothetical protein